MPRCRWVLPAVLTALTAMGAVACYLVTFTGQNAIPFDRSRWMAFEMDEGGCSTRYGMVGDLLRRHHFLGMSRAEVVQIIGPPTSECQNLTYDYPGWSLGRMPWGSDSTALCLKFSPDNRVISIWAP